MTKLSGWLRHCSVYAWYSCDQKIPGNCLCIPFQVCLFISPIAQEQQNLYCYANNSYSLTQITPFGFQLTHEILGCIWSKYTFESDSNLERKLVSIKCLKSWYSITSGVPLVVRNFLRRWKCETINQSTAFHHQINQSECIKFLSLNDQDTQL